MTIESQIERGRYISEAREHIIRKRKFAKDVVRNYAVGFLRRFYPNAEIHPNYRLGPIPESRVYRDLSPAEIQMFGSYRPRVHAIGITDWGILLVGAYRSRSYAQKGILKLPLLSRLVWETPELKDRVWGKFIDTFLIYPSEDKFLRSLCERYDVHFVVWDDPSVQRLRDEKKRLPKTTRSQRLVEDKYVAEFASAIKGRKKIELGHETPFGGIDLLIFEGKRILAIEGKVRPEEYFDGLSQANSYDLLINSDDKLKEEIGDRRIVKCLLIPRPDKFIEDEARRMGIKIFYFTPEWIKDYLYNLKKPRGDLPRLHTL